MENFAAYRSSYHSYSAPRVSSPRVSTPKAAPKASAPKVAKPKASTTKPAAPKTAKTTTTKSTPKKAVTSTPKTKTFTGAKQQYSPSGKTVGSSYQPHFVGGYHAPVGSVIYYPQHSAMDYLPWIYLFSQSSPQHDQAMVVQPNGKQVQAQPAKGVDGMAVFNWILMGVFVIAIIGGIVWFVNKKTQPKKAKPKESHVW